MTRIFGVIGDPISQSLSPLIHRGWMRDLALDADYRGFHVPAGQALSGLNSLQREGVRGLNVTMPHKSAVLQGCAEMSKLVAILGAANTLTRKSDGNWRADNTDRDGFLQDYLSFVGDFSGSRLLVIGAGGAARAIVHALNHNGAELVIANRTLSRAQDLCRQFAIAERRAIGLDQLPDAFEFADGVVNCISPAQARYLPPFPAGNGRSLFDLSYGKSAEAALDIARQVGWNTRDGIGMLVAQAALSFELWHGVIPDRAAGVERCRTALGAL